MTEQPDEPTNAELCAILGFVARAASTPERWYAPCRDAAKRIDDLTEALKLAADNLTHMAAHLSTLNSGYSFESLGEDMPTIMAALAKAGA